MNYKGPRKSLPPSPALNRRMKCSAQYVSFRRIVTNGRQVPLSGPLNYSSKALRNPTRRLTGGNAPRNLFALLKPQRQRSAISPHLARLEGVASIAVELTPKADMTTLLSSAGARSATH
jgi:hypothetical protein